MGVCVEWAGESGCEQNQGLMPSAVFTAQKWEGMSLGFAFRGRKVSWASFPI